MSKREAERCFVEAQQAASLGRRNDAIALYRRALSNHPGFVPALFALAQTLVVEGEPTEAFALLAAAMGRSRSEPRQHAIVLPAFAELLSRMRPEVYEPGLEAMVIECLESNLVDPQPLAGCAAALIAAKSPIDAAGIATLAHDPLWRAALTRAINVSADIERRLVALRRSMLLDLADGPLDRDTERAAVVLALQAHLNEYVWAISPEERAALDGQVHHLIAATYRPMVDFLSSASGKAVARDRLSRLLVKQTLLDPMADRQAAPSIDTFGEDGGNETSARVRDQYEENPYPRWITPPAPRRYALADHIAASTGVDLVAGRPVEVLIAGCGTGYELASLMLSDPDLKVTAIDLSRASLAYARRKLADLGFDDIDFRQGDLLDVGALGRHFDVIISSGVVHHMAEPGRGIAALASVLRPGGMIRLGMYSARARTQLRAARRLIAENGYDASADSIRSFRSQVLARDGWGLAAQLRESADFNSLSGCRDLLFHVCEHEFSVPGAADAIAAAGLEFLAVDAGAEVAAQFQRQFQSIADPANVELWDQMEAQDPTIFAEMMFLWARKPEPA